MQGFRDHYITEVDDRKDKVENFMMYKFKIKTCPNNLCSVRVSMCPYLHPKKGETGRRDLHIHNYRRYLCQKFERRECGRGVHCKNAHGRLEVQYHPMVFRTQMCRNSPCRRVACSFAHSEEEKRVIGLSTIPFTAALAAPMFGGSQYGDSNRHGYGHGSSSSMMHQVQGPPDSISTHSLWALNQSRPGASAVTPPAYAATQTQSFSGRGEAHHLQNLTSEMPIHHDQRDSSGSQMGWSTTEENIVEFILGD